MAKGYVSLSASLCCLLLAGCTGADSLVSLPGIARSSLELPVDSVETWELTAPGGDVGRITTVKTAEREYAFSGRFPASFFVSPVEGDQAGTLSYALDGTLLLRFSAPLPATVTASYETRNGGNTLEITPTGSAPDFAVIGKKTLLERKDLRRPKP